MDQPVPSVLTVTCTCTRGGGPCGACGEPMRPSCDCYEKCPSCDKRLCKKCLREAAMEHIEDERTTSIPCPGCSEDIPVAWMSFEERLVHDARLFRCPEDAEALLALALPKYRRTSAPERGRLEDAIDALSSYLFLRAAGRPTVPELSEDDVSGLRHAIRDLYSAAMLRGSFEDDDEDEDDD